MITTGLLIALALVAVMQPAGDRRAACCLFVALTLAFDLISAAIPGGLYYLAAAATDATCIGLLGLLNSRLGIVRALGKLCFVSIFLNFGGWAAYEMYVPSYYYNAAFYLFYAVALMVVCNGLSRKTDGVSCVLLPSD